MAAALSLSLLAAALSLVPGVPRPPAGWLEGAARPVFHLLSVPAQGARRGLDRLAGTEDLRRENRALKKELAVLRPLARQGELAAGENARLRSLLDLPQAGQSLDLTPAWVMGRTFDNWSRTVLLDKGTGQGLAAGQSVMDQAGALVGKIARTGPGWAAVTLVTDPGFTCGAVTAVSGIPGALEGDLSLMAAGRLRLACLTRADPVAAGETVVTFGAPSGLTVGTVRALSDDPGGLTRWAAVDPAADLEDLTEVFVVTGVRETR